MFMITKWEKTEKNLGILEVEVDPGALAQALDQAFKKVVKKVNLPGFRKGRVPRAVFEARFGVEALYNDALDLLLPEAYAKAVEEAQIEPVSQPEIDVVQLEKGKPFIFKAKVTVKPEVELGTYKGVTVEDKEFPVTEEDVDKELENLRRQHAQIEVVGEGGTVQNEDLVMIDFEGFVDGEPLEGGQGEDYQLEIGSGTFVQGFEEQLIGMAQGEDREIRVTFPDDYHVEGLRGKEALFKVHLHDIKRKRLPELDDEFAKDISEFETLEELRADLKNKLEQRAEQDHRTYLENQVVDKVVEGAVVEVPSVMVEHELEHLYHDFADRLQRQGISTEMYFEVTGSSKEKVKEQMRPDAEKRVRTSLVLEAVQKQEGIEPTEEEVEAELEKAAESMRMDVARLKELLTPSQLDSLRQDLAIRKTVDFLVANSTSA
ncbi:prolyl isomerase (trigger factor) [Kyrpidia spormannii]|uniref:Trigger factor n=2 Tax=Alicyclobacillaceae TaxID=186823 RepID=A0A6F9E6F6_9BACL|nr:prolyl isomerase (trigger factor) [Kyrpidia spormannii]